jgi:hypothetical protein
MSLNDITGGAIDHILDTKSDNSSNSSKSSKSPKSNIVIDTAICNQDAKANCAIIQKEDSLNTNITETTTIESITEGENKVNITIKSCKNITSKQALLIIPITKFFSDRKMLNRLITILKGEGLSLRLIDWFVTNYCKKFNIMYNVMDYRSPIPGQTEVQRKSFDNFIIVHTNYKGQLKAYSKKNFDPFCRRNRIRFYYEDGKYFITTVGQLNFFKWALECNIVDYVERHMKEIEDDMNLRCENIKKPGTKTAPIANNGEDDEPGTRKNKPQDGSILITTEKNIKTKKAIGTRKKRKEISQSASKSLSIHNFPTTLVFD